VADRVDPAGLTATRRGVASANAKLPLRGDGLYPFLEELSGLRSPAAIDLQATGALLTQIRAAVSPPPKGLLDPIFRSEAGAA
jgi:hypothetical protein